MRLKGKVYFIGVAIVDVSGFQAAMSSNWPKDFVCPVGPAASRLAQVPRHWSVRNMQCAQSVQHHHPVVDEHWRHRVQVSLAADNQVTQRLHDVQHLFNRRPVVLPEIVHATNGCCGPSGTSGSCMQSHDGTVPSSRDE